MFDAARVDSSLLQDIFVFRGEIFANNRHDADIGEVAGGQSKIGSRAAEDVFHFSGRAGDGIERYGADGDNAHAFFAFRYLPKMSFNFCRVLAGILARSVRMACAREEPHLHPRSLGMEETVSRTTLVAFSAFFNSTATT